MFVVLGSEFRVPGFEFNVQKMNSCTEKSPSGDLGVIHYSFFVIRYSLFVLNFTQYSPSLFLNKHTSLGHLSFQ
jgi:hypothetical protein